ncbi:GTP cyclohydrolase FolE2 [Arenimonas terrae]|uniref:GTP cyclohydrolase FolE2 n=1 Tax=Arenimonas terrae TaxID=2546226 RepID=A0A5C4RXI1_9GAMM|nr:GTP cyclohydrolase FolE2 [Arenimonas terrae]TNJ35830.1 GTP cyclohydrolase I FolE2 [Arenimonas terrae]
MPDIAAEARPALAGVLDWVGMGEIEMPLMLQAEDGRTVSSGARVNAFVNLKRGDVRGIHMSRLYLHVDKALSNEPVTPASVRRLLRDFLESHAELSDRAMISLRFEHLVRRAALASDNSGWKSYPVTITGVMDRGHFALELGLEAAYSSTCPCSAALARQLIQEQFESDFASGQPLDREAVLAWLGTEQGIRATPHSQRSIAEVKLRLVPSFQNFPIVEIIDRIEGALKTPVQTAVKRVDEQAFALLNGQNLMFCEDAARRMQDALEQDGRISDFWLRATHQESLHPHDAVAVATKGVPGGYTALPDGLAAR